MELLIYALCVLIVVSIVCAIAYYVPFPPPLAWLRWAVPAIALLIALVVILQRLVALP